MPQRRTRTEVVQEPTTHEATVATETYLERVKAVCDQFHSVAEQAEALGLSPRAWQLRRVGLVAVGILDPATGGSHDRAPLQENETVTTKVTRINSKRPDVPASSIPAGILKGLNVAPGDSIVWTMGAGFASLQKAKA